VLETSARLLRLLSVLQARRYWSGHDLAARLEVTCRTLRRDVDKLRNLGYPIHSASGAEGGYQLGAGLAMPPLLLDDEEAVAVALGLRQAVAGTVEGIEEASSRALAKMEQILPSRLSRRVAALQTMIVTRTPTAESVDARLLSAMAGACRENETLRFRYRDHAGVVSSRTVEPHRLVNTGRRWYLVAWDTNRQDWRTFRADRIEPRVSTGARFAPRDPPAKDLAAWVTKGVWSAPRFRARIRLLTSAENAVARLPFSMGLLEPIDADSCYFDMAGSTWESLAMHLMLLGVDFEVCEPAELIREIKQLQSRCERAVKNPSDAPMSLLGNH
jgi:predicted DNA-binding transcriptional regulator YafY